MGFPPGPVLDRDLIGNRRNVLYAWRMTDIRRIDPGPRLSEASSLGDRMYLSGMIPEDTSQDVTGQVRQAVGEIDALLAQGATAKTQILRTATSPAANPD